MMHNIFATILKKYYNFIFFIFILYFKVDLFNYFSSILTTLIFTEVLSEIVDTISKL